MPLSSSQLEAFLAVAKTNNFTKAAESLHITQSALSQRVLNLEAELGTTLFLRDRAGLKLTEAGASLVRYCQMKNSLESDFLASLRSENTKELAGIVRIGAFSSVMHSILVPLLGALVQEHPKLRVHSLTRELSELLDLLKRGEIDYMILDDRLEREELERMPLGKEKNVLTRSKLHKDNEVYLDHDESDETTLRYFKEAKIKNSNLQRHYLDDIHGVIAGVKSGLGRAVLPLHLIQKDKELLLINPEQVLEVPVYLYYYARPYYSTLHQELVKRIKSGFARVL